MTPNLLDLPPLTPEEITALETAVADLLGLTTPGNRRSGAGTGAGAPGAGTGAGSPETGPAEYAAVGPRTSEPGATGPSVAGSSVSRDVVLVPGEAILALEATARSVARPGATVINVETGPYGALFGAWMAASGAEVVNVRSPLDAVSSPEDLLAVLNAHPGAEVLAVVHAEAATGGTNPLGELLAIARERGLLTVVDAVASVGAEPVPFTDADVVAIGPQKGLAGPAGISALTVSARAWERMGSNPAAPRESSLSLLDLHERWVATDRSAYPGYLPWLEARAFHQAVERVAAEIGAAAGGSTAAGESGSAGGITTAGGSGSAGGVDVDGAGSSGPRPRGLASVEDRHRRAARAARAGIEVLGLEPWQRRPAAAAPILTTVRLPDDVAGVDSASGIVGPGPGPLAGRLVRVEHTGRAATLGAVTTALTELAAIAPWPGELPEAIAAAEAAHAG